jgi:hypothetical protein
MKTVGSLSPAVLIMAAVALTSCAQAVTTAVGASQPQVAPAPPSPTANSASPAVKFDAGDKPDRSFVKISDRIGSRDPNSPDCEFYIKVQNLHTRWSLKNVAVDLNGTVYVLADVIGPGESAEFYRASLPRPATSYHVYYDWKPPG